MNEIEKYISQYTGELNERLTLIRNTIKAAAPEAIEKISWSMPTFYLKGNLIHFAAAKKHIGIYPGPDAIIHFKEELKNYVTSKGAIQLQNSEDIPYQLIEKIVKYRVLENNRAKK